MANAYASSSSSTGLSGKQTAMVIIAVIGLIVLAAISTSDRTQTTVGDGYGESHDTSGKVDSTVLNDIYGKLNAIHEKLNHVESQQQHQQHQLNSQQQQQPQKKKNSDNHQDTNNKNSNVPAISPSSSSSYSYSSSASTCKPQIRYEPTPWKRGARFPVGKTPLTMLINNEVPKVEMPADWDGGYGWIFVQYHPSPFETRWKKEVKRVEKIMTGSPICELRNRSFAKEEAAYEKEFYRMPADNGGNEKCTGFPDEPMKFDDEIFSKFEYEFKCTRPPCKSPPPLSPRIGETKFTYIEPLVGLLRHPHACTRWQDYSWLVNKNYMIVDPWSLVNPSRSTISPEPKVLYLDGGASTWNAGLGGASQSWFHKVYEGKCLNFTDWYMYEATNVDPKQVYKLLPGHVKPGYRWQNIFLKTDPADWDNPINTLLVEAKKEDVVIFKIDFDSAHVEAALLQLILDHQEVADLIDELYFEHHVNLEILRPHWATAGSQIYHSDSLKLFTALREKGVRAHSWV